MIVGDFNSPFYIIDRITRQKISKDTENLTHTNNKLDLTGLYKKKSLNRIHIVFKHTWNILQVTPKSRLHNKSHKFKRKEVIQNTFFHHNRERWYIQQLNPRSQSYLDTKVKDIT